MLDAILPLVPPDVLKIALVLALAFFVGLEREDHKQREASYAFGGVRTFPLIGLVSYALALLSTPDLTPWAIGFAVIGALMLLSYQRKLSGEPRAGLTTEVSALATYVVGGLVQREDYWIATTISVLSVLLLELKKGLEGLTRRFASNEIITVAKFLVLSVVILPIVPDREFTPFHLNPFNTWLVVVVVSGVSYASYVLQRLFEQRGGVILSALLGGAYSSTVTTVVLARQSHRDSRPNLFAGSTLAASGVMYARLVLLIAFFDRSLAAALAPHFIALAAIGGLAGWRIAHGGDGAKASVPSAREVRNPLELWAALLFALALVAILVLVGLARDHLGRAGLFGLAAIMGVADVDPFVLGVAQGGGGTPLRVAAAAIAIAAASNNVIKAIYAYSFSDRETGRRSLILLLGFALLGLAPLVWL
jgi:uncharacterized membrane protein (DUF4010 family)